MDISRRDALRAAGLLAAGAMWPGAASPALAAPAAAHRLGRKRALRLAHLTDFHIQPERAAAEGVAACLRHVQSHAEKPDLILTGGDLVMDSFEQGEARTKLQWDLFTKVFKSESSLPVEHCLGNHDCWGWNKKESKTTGDEPLWGKRRAMDLFGLPAPYRSFDRAGWHFIVLDSTFAHEDGYIARLDDEQFEWLKGDLAAVPADRPVLILSHMPIVSATCMFFGEKDEREGNDIPPSWMHVDAKKLTNLFLKHRNVKLSIAGHMHLVDRVDYNHVTYFCNGAVSANWWKGRHYECDEGYALIDLYDDGTFEREYVTYGWKARG